MNVPTTQPEVTAQTTETSEPKVEVSQKEAKSPRPRNYSFLKKNPDHLDTVESKDGRKFVIPAAVGSTYWSIMYVGYEHADEPVYPDMLLSLVDGLLTERKPEKWNAYKAKAQTTVYRKGEGRRSVQPTKTWEERMLNNANTLTRMEDYGVRLIERGHIWRREYDDKGQIYYILRTNLDCLKNEEKKDSSANS